VLGTPSANSWKQGLALAQNMNFKFPQFVATPLAQLIPSASPEVRVRVRARVLSRLTLTLTPTLALTLTLTLTLTRPST